MKQRSRRETPLPPLFRTPEIDALHDDEPAWVAAMQLEIRYLCARLEFWRHCRSPRCRRARACHGSHGPQNFHRNFPPCVSSHEFHHRWCEEWRRYEDELQEAYQCFGDE